MPKRRGEIVPIKDLFSKYRNTLIAPQQTVEVEVLRVVGELLGFTLKEGQVKYTVSTRTISLLVPGIMKQEIKLKQREILAELKKRLGAKNSPEILL